MKKYTQSKNGVSLLKCYRNKNTVSIHMSSTKVKRNISFKGLFMVGVCKLSWFSWNSYGCVITLAWESTHLWIPHSPPHSSRAVFPGVSYEGVRSSDCVSNKPQHFLYYKQLINLKQTI